MEKKTAISTDPQLHRAQAWCAAWKLIDLCELLGDDLTEIVKTAEAERNKVLSRAFSHRRA